MSDYPGRPFTGTRNRLQAALAELLDDGTGQIRPELQPFADSLLAMAKPDRALNWLRNNALLPTYLRSLARGQVELSHDGLHELGSWRTVAHLRDLLMACGTLPAVDRQITLFERWAQERLTATADAEHGRLLRQFVSWHQLPQLHASARRAPLSAGARNYAAEVFLEAEQLLPWLDRHALSLAMLSQRELDRWEVDRADRSAKVLLRWAQRSGHSPRLQQAPTVRRTRQAPLSPRRRLAWTGRILTDDTSSCAPAPPPACCCCSPNRSPGASSSPSTTSSTPSMVTATARREQVSCCGWDTRPLPSRSRSRRCSSSWSTPERT